MITLVRFTASATAGTEQVTDAWKSRLLAGLWLGLGVCSAQPQALAQTSGSQAAMPMQVQACSVCHGQQGIALVPDAPNLAGQPALYLSSQLKDYRSGARKHEVMGLMAKRLSDADIEVLAQWFANQRIRLDAAN
jgi:cytochrome c553